MSSDDAPTVAELTAYLQMTSPARARGMGSVRAEFVVGAKADAAPALEFLLHRDGAWYVRWPNGTVRWELEPHLRARGHAIPAAPVSPAFMRETVTAIVTASRRR